MTESEIDLRDVKKYMVAYYLILKIYEIYNFFYEKDEDDGYIEYSKIETNDDLINIITDINFVFSPGVGRLDKIKEITKIGNLINIEVYLNPDITDNKIIFYDRDKTNSFTLDVFI